MTPEQRAILRLVRASVKKTIPHRPGRARLEQLRQKQRLAIEKIMKAECTHRVRLTLAPSRCADCGARGLDHL